MPKHNLRRLRQSVPEVNSARPEEIPGGHRRGRQKSPTGKPDQADRHQNQQHDLQQHGAPPAVLPCSFGNRLIGQFHVAQGLRAPVFLWCSAHTQNIAQILARPRMHTPRRGCNWLDNATLPQTPSRKFLMEDRLRPFSACAEKPGKPSSIRYVPARGLVRWVVGTGGVPSLSKEGALVAPSCVPNTLDIWRVREIKSDFRRLPETATRELPFHSAVVNTSARCS